MELKMVTMDEQFAFQILHWKYEQPYNPYNGEYTEGGMCELLDNSYYALIDEENELFGFFCTGKSAQVPAGQSMGAYDENLIDLGFWHES